MINPEILTDEIRSWLGNDVREHHLWVKQKFITELGVDDYEAAWDFAQYPLPADKTERAEVISKLRMNEMTWEDCNRLYGAGAAPAVTTTVQPATTTGETLAPETVETEKSNLGVILAIVIPSITVIVTAIAVIVKKRGKKS
jgi:hypothetical protein